MDPHIPPRPDLILVRTRGLEREVFAVMEAGARVLIAGITEDDLHPAGRMEAIILPGETPTLYWGSVDALSYRVQGALRDSLEAPEDQHMARTIPAAALEDGQSTGDDELDALLAAEPAFHQLIKDCFRRSSA